MTLKRTVILLSINLAVFCACAEILGLIVYYYQHGWLFYANPYRQKYELISDDARGQALTDIGLSPYFGPIHRAGYGKEARSARVGDPRSPP